ncbi:MAG: GNAT family N-acetyltransferase [Deinococcales bacterium]
MQLLTVDDVRTLLPPRVAAEAMEHAFRLKAGGRLAAPPRTSVPSAGGRLVLTVGGALTPHGATGFRAYHTAPGATDQLVTVFDGSTGELRGVVVGRLLGALRTAAINAVAIRTLAREDARVLGVLGTGRQARAHARVALAVRPFEHVRVFSPDPAHRLAFAAELAADTGVDAVAADDAEAVARAADVLVVATGSRTPVLEAGWIRPGTHVNAVGPKTRGRCELPAAVGALAARITSDSLEQVDAYPEPFFLDDADRARMVGLERVLAGEAPGRGSADEVTLFCSTGLAGTEVLLAEALLQAHQPSTRTGPEAAGAASATAPQPTAPQPTAPQPTAPQPAPGAAPRRTPAIRLAPMAPDAFEAYLARTVADYAAEHVRAGNLRPQDARARAEQQVRQLLPAGVATPGHALLHIEDGGTGERVGIVWYQLRDVGGGREAFVFDLWVDERWRRRGYASGALAEVETRAAEAGAGRVSLHVFGHNERARRLYRALGFEETDVMMAKRL